MDVFSFDESINKGYNEYLSNLNPIINIEINKGLISNKNNEGIKNPRLKIQQ